LRHTVWDDISDWASHTSPITNIIQTSHHNLKQNQTKSRFKVYMYFKKRVN